MRVVRRNGNLIHKPGAKSLNGANGRYIVRVASDDNSSGDGANKRTKSAARVQGVTVPAKWLKNLEADVPGTDTNMVGVAHAKTDVSNVGAVLAHNAEVISRDETALWIAGNNLDEPQSHLAKGQGLGRNRNSVTHSK